MTLLTTIIFIILFLVLIYHRLSLWLTSLLIVAYLAGVSYYGLAGWIAQSILWLLAGGLIIFLNIKQLRRQWLSRMIFAVYKRYMPELSETEKQAIAVGTVGWEGELFSGKQNWNHILRSSRPRMSEEEQAFIDGPVEKLCQMIDNWYITHEIRDIPDDIWQFLKEKRFFGMILPKEYGGLAFSALAHSNVLTKIASRSITIATVVGVPNSLGPGELLLKYGTEQQKQYYLPKLAQGHEIPAFGLTSPYAGSDATAIVDTGVVCHETFDGEQKLCIRLNWDKRYITLSPVATVLGLAFRLYDPDNLLSDDKEPGITCALVPTELPGVITGRRHQPMESAFPNGPTQGHDVIIPADYIIGGTEMAGQGWMMLVECLSVGRGISLPAMTTGGAKAGAYASGAYAQIRQQFGLPIGRFEGVQEPLARIACYSFIMDATRLLTVSAIDRGEKPAIPAAISKHYVTEFARLVANDCMDVHGGKGICLGPKNYLAQGYEEMPISITVEGANILTRSMMIFGQGSIRCHPYIMDELRAANDPNDRRGLHDFDNAFFGHVGYLLSNVLRSFWLALTQGRLLTSPRRLKGRGVTRRHYQQIVRMSASFALFSDVAMIVLGSEFKRKEFLSSRFADVLSYLYMASAVLKAYEDHGGDERLREVVKWSCQFLLHHAQQQMDELLHNFPNKWAGKVLRLLIFPLGKRIHKPKDDLTSQVAEKLQATDGLRQLLAKNTNTTDDPNNPMAGIDRALQLVIEAEPLERILKQALKDGQLNALTKTEQAEQANELGLINSEQAELIAEAEKARLAILAVDDFEGRSES